MTIEVLDSRTSPNAFVPFGLRYHMEPSRPPFNRNDLDTELLPVQLNQLLGWVRDDHITHKLVWPMYYYAEGDCVHYANHGDLSVLEEEDYEEGLVTKGLHLYGEDGYLCTAQPGGFGCQECESSECERVCELEDIVTEFWETIGQGYLAA